MYYRIDGKKYLTAAVWVLAVCRIALCLMPQNAWTSKNAPLSWGIYRNIPFTILGVLIVVLFYKSAKDTQDKAFRFLWIAVMMGGGIWLRSSAPPKNAKFSHKKYGNMI